MLPPLLLLWVGVVLLLLLACVCWVGLLGWAGLPCCCTEARCGEEHTCGSMCKQQCVCSRQLETTTTKIRLATKAARPHCGLSTTQILCNTRPDTLSSTL
jgi:hypothetical protein